MKGVAGAKGLSVKHSRFEDVGVGIHRRLLGLAQLYIAGQRDDWPERTGLRHRLALNQWPWNRQLPDLPSAGGG